MWSKNLTIVAVVGISGSDLHASLQLEELSLHICEDPLAYETSVRMSREDVTVGSKDAPCANSV